MDYNYNNNYQQTPEPKPQTKGFSIASMVLGICGFLAWCIPLFGYPVCITGLVLGIIGVRKNGKGMAIAGIIMCVLTLIFTVINSAIGAYMGATGQL